MTNDQAEDQVTVEYGIPNDKTVSISTIHIVSKLKGCDPLTLTPLYDSIDPEALDDLCESQEEGTVKFVFSDFRITVVNGDYLKLRPVD